MKKIIFTLILGFFISSFFVFAENDSITELKTKNQIKFRDLSVTVVRMLNLASSDITPEDAINLLINEFPKLNRISNEAYLSYRDVSFIAMQVWNISGGLFYSIFQNKHYSFRELQFKELIPLDIDPYKKISGADALSLILNSAGF